ncbi:MAG: YggS family pyridoxal phosphate-dependent enzyme [Chloroflexi bacterium]|nr:YggS family pyridoxal phosphate-dependent enzyme [Chloroflexota bacterium]
MSIAGNLEDVRNRIIAAAQRAGRPSSQVRLVAVTKFQPLSAIEELYKLGVRDFGENRIQEASEKLTGWSHPGATIHMIGHLQRNKVRQAVEIVDCIQSLDSVRLAEAIDHQCQRTQESMPVLMEINISGEEAKHGFQPVEVFDALPELARLNNIRLQGVMTMAPIVPQAEAARPYFRRLRELRDELERRFPDCRLPELSMGMTDDFEIAVEEGATMVRVGRALFV